jgi:hypothetical protein
MKNKTKDIPELLIPNGYDVSEILDMGKGEDEKEIYMEEVRLRFE